MLHFLLSREKQNVKVFTALLLIRETLQIEISCCILYFSFVIKWLRVFYAMVCISV